MIKSQDELTTAGSRQSDVLIEAINNAKSWFDVARELQEENKKLRKWCEEFNALEVAYENAKLKNKLKIAVDILEVISTHTIIPDEDTVGQVGMVYNWSSEALNQIEELNK